MTLSDFTAYFDARGEADRIRLLDMLADRLGATVDMDEVTVGLQHAAYSHAEQVTRDDAGQLADTIMPQGPSNHRRWLQHRSTRDAYLQQLDKGLRKFAQENR
jgi:hypothetical protein